MFICKHPNKSKTINTSLSTISFDAEIYDSQTFNAEVGSCLDSQNKTHIAWIKDTGVDRFLMYSVFDPSTNNVTTIEITAGQSTELKIAPYIVTDANNNPHITYIIRRDESAGTTSGNHAVMYAGDGDGNGTFEVLQVSTNSTDPTDDTDNIYNCWVNGRPNIFFDNGQLVVSYFSDANTLNSYKNYFIFATKSGSTWTHNQEFSEDDMIYHYTAHGVSFPVLASSDFHAGFVGSNDKPFYIYKNASTWSLVEITGYEGTFANDDVQLEHDKNGTIHYLWFNDINNKFCHTTLNGGGYGTVNEYDIVNSHTGNFFPATVDLLTGEPIFIYRKYLGNSFLIVLDESNQPIEVEIPDIGVVFGRESLHVNNGYLSFVTASDGSNKIYITTNEATASDPPDADFSANVTTIAEGGTVTFTDLSTNSPTEWSWNFGDGNTSTEQNPAHVFNTQGTYSITLTVTNSSGSDTETKTDYITVTESGSVPVADFSANVTTIAEGGTVTFTDLSTNIPTEWSWSFGDGSSSSTQNPLHTYNTAGIYTVSLTAINANGADTEIKTNYITVNIIDYCDAGSDNSSYEYIGHVVMGSIDKSSDASSYSDYTDFSTDVYPGNNQSFTITSVSGYNTDHVLIWVDWNCDSDFGDSGENVFTSSEGQGPYSGTFAVPDNVTPGSVRVRIRLEDNDSNPVNSPCGNSGYGEVEDYTLNIVESVGYTVTFMVNDGTNVISGANVTIDEVTKTTDTSGETSFEMYPGNYTYDITAEGYNNVRGDIDVVNTDVNEVVTLSIDTGIDDIDSERIEIYPNPTGGIINIQGCMIKSATISVFDISGKKILTKLSDNDLIRIDISEYVSGTYIIQITKDQSVYKKLIIKE